MHPEALNGVRWAIKDSDFAGYFRDLPDTKIGALDLGGADINGTARGVVTEPAAHAGRYVSWYIWDIVDGRGVMRVVDATLPAPEDAHGLFDVVVCTEVLEHVAAWQEVLRFIHTVLVPGGFAFITCASTGRRPHGARGELDPGPGEHYGNIHAIDLDSALEDLKFSDFLVRYNPTPGDAYAWAVK